VGKKKSTRRPQANRVIHLLKDGELPAMFDLTDTFIQALPHIVQDDKRQQDQRGVAYTCLVTSALAGFQRHVLLRIPKQRLIDQRLRLRCTNSVLSAVSRLLDRNSQLPWRFLTTHKRMVPYACVSTVNAMVRTWTRFRQRSFSRGARSRTTRRYPCQNMMLWRTAAFRSPEPKADGKMCYAPVL
jgi:hypothetical protein